MKASVRWLNEISGIEASADVLADKLTRAGIEVEGITRFGAGLEHVVVAEVRSQRAHPKKEKLTLVTVFDGERELEIVCGAPNVPDAKSRVVLAKLGAVLPGGMRIEARDIAGVPSTGMLCSEKELGIGHDESGILVLEGSPKVGALVTSALTLEDSVLELSLTPNRPDALGHLGLARELSVLMQQPFAPRLRSVPSRLLATMPAPPGGNEGLPLLEGTTSPQETVNMVSTSPGALLALPIEIEDGARCPRYLGLVLQRSVTRRAPFWMRYRLFTVGQRAIDAVVDATNWVLLETGHPIHAFDLDKLAGAKVVVRTARSGEILRTLDGIERKLTTDDLVIADAEKPVALAGVIGGADSAVSESTTALFLEAAYFDPRSVRRTARRHGIHTEASHRFERGMDPQVLPFVARRAATLLAQVADAAPSACIVEASARKIAPSVIAVDPAYFARFLGDDVPVGLAREILEALGCHVSPAAPSGWRVTAPSHRPDLTRPEDLAEEIARVRGYDRIPSALLARTPDASPPDPRPSILRALRRGAMAAGLFEAVSFTFLSPKDLALSRAPADAIALANPLSEERSVMRTSLLPGLLAAASRSERHQTSRIRLFELARTYAPAKAEGALSVPVRERATFAILVAGPRDRRMGEDEPVDFFDGKGALETALASVRLELTTVPDDGIEKRAPYLHPRRSARVVVLGEDIGVIGELHPDVVEAHALSSRPVYAELSTDALVRLASERGPRIVEALPRFPKVQRDLAIVVPSEILAADVAAALSEAAGGLVEDVALFDVYEGKPVPEGHKSLAFRIAYRDREATLTDARIETVHAAVLASAEKRFGARVRA
jgi:phenylalanyl-tRNA synthetase beta chain